MAEAAGWPQRPRVLFLCTGNACRSQMAEGWARHLHGDGMEVFSAGLVAQGVDPNAVAVMAEAGVDISGQRSKQLESVAGRTFDYVITLCGGARDRCPLFPGKVVLHQGFDDPPALAREAATEDEALAHYRRVRDELRAWVAQLPQQLGISS